MSTKVVTGKVRFSYANVFTPKAASEGGEPKYSMSIIIPKSDEKTLNDIRNAIEEATKEGIQSKFNGKKPLGLKTPLRDGDEEREDEAYKNAYFINCSSKNRPGIIDRNRVEILDSSELKSGDYGRVSVNFYAFNVNGNRGIACGLNNIQLLQKGEPLGAVNDPATDFADDWNDDDEF